MQPLKPEVVERVLRERPHVTREDISEYQRLLASRFTVNPHTPKTLTQQNQHQAREARIKELHDKIFG